MRTTAILLSLVILMFGCGSRGGSAENEPERKAKPKETVKDEPKKETEDTMVVEKNPTAIIKTNKGDIEVELYAKDAPKTVENFIGLAKKGYFDGLAFHRVIPDFMVQGGDPTGSGGGGESIFGEKFDDEINAKSLGLDEIIVKDSPLYESFLKRVHDPAVVEANKDKSLMELYEALGYKYNDKLTSHKMVKGSLAMANSGPNTNGSQFFIVSAKPQPHLDGKHTVFGEVTKGMDVVQKLRTDDKIVSVTVESETDMPEEPEE